MLKVDIRIIQSSLSPQGNRCRQINHHNAPPRDCVFSAAFFLLQHGAESALVEELSTRLGLALGMDSVESSISSNAIVLTTIKAGQCLTSTRKNTIAGSTCTW